MKNNILTKATLLIFITVLTVVFRVVEVLSVNSVGAVEASWATVTLWVLVALTVLSALIFKDERLNTEPQAFLSLGGGIAAFALGFAIIADSVWQYAHHVFQATSQGTSGVFRLDLFALIAGGCASLSMVFIVAPVNAFPKTNIYGKVAKGLPSVSALWLGFVLIGVFFLNKTSSLTTLNAFSVLAYCAYLFFFLAYMKVFCGVKEKSVYRKLYRWGLVSASFLICNIATKIAYVYITHENAVSSPYAFGMAGIILDFAMLAFALCNIVKIRK